MLIRGTITEQRRELLSKQVVVVELPDGASEEDIKKAIQKKARSVNGWEIISCANADITNVDSCANADITNVDIITYSVIKPKGDDADEKPIEG